MDFDQQYFAERESIWQRQFCVVEQYSYFSQQRHFGDGILQHTIFILELDVRTPLCGGDNFLFLGQKKNKTEIGMWMVVDEFLFLIMKSLKSRRLNLLSNHEIYFQKFSSSRNWTLLQISRNCLQKFSFSSRTRKQISSRHFSFIFSKFEIPYFSFSSRFHFLEMPVLRLDRPHKCKYLPHLFIWSTFLYLKCLCGLLNDML